jgi:succinate-acetate transporter protein
LGTIQNQVIKKKDNTANPAPIGLLGFALTTFLLNIHNADFLPVDSMILAMGIFYGGLAQIIAGMLEWRKGNTFASFAFLSYGMFWLSFVAMTLMSGWGWMAAPTPASMGMYLVSWGVLSLVLFVYTLRTNFISKAVFGTVTILFFLLAISNFTGSHTIKVIAGWEGMLCAALAFYDGAAQILESGKKEPLPLSLDES